MAEMMRALKIVAKLDMRIEEVPVPTPSNNQVRVRIAYVGICGTDLHYYFEGANGAFVIKEPLTPGHELSGVVDLDPSGKYPKGTPVTFHPATLGKPEEAIQDRPNIWPGGRYFGSAATFPHTQGGAADFMIVESSMIRVLPSSLPLKTAALAEPLAVGLHAIVISGGVEDKTVLISGAGPIGLLLAEAAKIKGAREVTISDVLPGPLERATALGGISTVRIGAQALLENHFDIVFECSGVIQALSSALVAVRRGGIVVQVGTLASGDLPVAINPIIAKEIELRGTFRFSDEVDEAIVLLDQNSAIAKVITHEFSLERAVEALEVAKDSQISGKVLIAVNAGE